MNAGWQNLHRYLLESTEGKENEPWYGSLMQAAYEMDQAVFELLEEKSGRERSTRRIEDEKELKIRSLENELRRSLQKIEELEQKMDNEGEVIQILN